MSARSVGASGYSRTRSAVGIVLPRAVPVASNMQMGPALCLGSSAYLVRKTMSTLRRKRSHFLIFL